jgi:hypothetical protein
MMLKIRLRESETAIRHVERLGFRADDVRHIIATHLDFDHAGGLENFPQATVHVMQREYDDATGPRASVVARNRWRPAQLDQVQQWQGYSARGAHWYGFDAVRDLHGLPLRSSWFRFPGTRGATPAWRSAATMFNDYYTPATPISTAARCARLVVVAPRGCVHTRN